MKEGEQLRRVEEVKRFAEEATKRFDFIKSIVLIGSVARGDFTEKSDTDVLVILDDEKQGITPELSSQIHEELTAAARRISASICIATQIFSVTEFIQRMQRTNPIVYIMLKEGIAIYDKDFFFPVQQFFQNNIKIVDLSYVFYHSTGALKWLRKMELDILHFLKIRTVDYINCLVFSANVLLMGMGIEPQAPARICSVMDDELVKPGFLERNYVDWLNKELMRIKKIDRHPHRRYSISNGLLKIKKAKKFASKMRKLLIAHARPEVLVFLVAGGAESGPDNADKKIEVQVMNMSDQAELEQQLYKPMSRRSFLKTV